MGNMKDEELREILERHKRWLNNEVGGKCADLSGVDLCEVDLVGANLDYADLRGANLYCADLRMTSFHMAKLQRADLRGANFQYANLQAAGFQCALLEGADFAEADLRWADLRWTDLRMTSLLNADLKGVSLDFSGFPLWCGSLSADFDNTQLKQIAYHLVKAGLNSKNASEETKNELKKLIDFANGFHRVDECGLIEE